ncbi:MAG: hypothetical protein WCR46_16690 [Deltaproteobacteria bacterium]
MNGAVIAGAVFAGIATAQQNDAFYSSSYSSFSYCSGAFSYSSLISGKSYFVFNGSCVNITGDKMSIYSSCAGLRDNADYYWSTAIHNQYLSSCPRYPVFYSSGLP